MQYFLIFFQKILQYVLFHQLSKYQAWKCSMILQRQLAADQSLFTKRRGGGRQKKGRLNFLYRSLRGGQHFEVRTF